MGLPPPAEGAEDKGGISEFDCMSENEESAARTKMDEIQNQENQGKACFRSNNVNARNSTQLRKCERGNHGGGLGARLSSC